MENKIILGFDGGNMTGKSKLITTISDAMQPLVERMLEKKGKLPFPVYELKVFKPTISSIEMRNLMLLDKDSETIKQLGSDFGWLKLVAQAYLNKFAETMEEVKAFVNNDNSLFKIALVDRTYLATIAYTIGTYFNSDSYSLNPSGVNLLEAILNAIFEDTLGEKDILPFDRIDVLNVSKEFRQMIKEKIESGEINRNKDYENIIYNDESLQDHIVDAFEYILTPAESEESHIDILKSSFIGSYANSIETHAENVVEYELESIATTILHQIMTKLDPFMDMEKKEETVEEEKNEQVDEDNNPSLFDTSCDQAPIEDEEVVEVEEVKVEEVENIEIPNVEVSEDIKEEVKQEEVKETKPVSFKDIAFTGNQESSATYKEGMKEVAISYRGNHRKYIKGKEIKY